MELIAVAALSENFVVGKDGEIPWESLPEDREQYRSRVANDPVILGRRTFESMLDDLPGSAQIVMSRSESSFAPNTAVHARTVEEAIDHAEAFGGETAYVLGGGKIYELFQPHLTGMALSRVPGKYDGDSFYPEWNPDEWELVAETPYDGFTLQEWKRV